MSTDYELQDVYDAYAELSAELLEMYPPEAIAGVMVAEALSFYRTYLSPEDYEYITTAIYDSRNDIKIFTPPKNMLQ